jgi:hypothetical protein
MSEDDDSDATDWRSMRRVKAVVSKPFAPAPPTTSTFCPVFVKPVPKPAVEAPRGLKKGEFGKDPEQLALLEKSGFVMSGARSARIAMIRELKSAETPTEDQRRAELLKKMEEKEAREDAIVEGFRELLLAKRRRKEES